MRTTKTNPECKTNKNTGGKENWKNNFKIIFPFFCMVNSGLALKNIGHQRLGWSEVFSFLLTTCVCVCLSLSVCLFPCVGARVSVGLHAGCR